MQRPAAITAHYTLPQTTDQLKQIMLQWHQVIMAHMKLVEIEKTCKKRRYIASLSHTLFMRLLESSKFWCLRQTVVSCHIDNQSIKRSVSVRYDQISTLVTNNCSLNLVNGHALSVLLVRRHECSSRKLHKCSQTCKPAYLSCNKQ